MCILDKGALFIAPVKSCYKESVHFQKSLQVLRAGFSCLLLFCVIQALISEENSEGTLVYLTQLTTEEKGQKQCHRSFFWGFCAESRTCVLHSAYTYCQMLASKTLGIEAQRFTIRLQTQALVAQRCLCTEQEFLDARDCLF